MKAFVATQLNKQSQGSIQEVPKPLVDDNDVLVKVHATSVNPLDLKILQGELKMLVPYKTPLILGNDVAGTIEQVGKKVTQFQVGDEIYSRPDKDRIGTFAEYIALDQADVALKPKNLTMTQASSIPLIGLTAWQALVEKANVQAGQKVLIHAGSGGVGTFAIQLAKHLGAYVATTASAKNADWLKQLGADEVIDYKTTDFSTVLSDYDVVLDTQGGDTLNKSAQILKQGGKIISLAGAPDPQFAKEFGASWIVKAASPLLSHKIRKLAAQKNASYSFLFMRADGKQLTQITQLIEAGIITPVIDRTFDFSQTQQALDYVAQGRSKGKVVITLLDELQ